MDEAWADAAWKGLESQGWEEMKLSATTYFYISPEINSVDAFQKNSTAFGSKGEAVTFALQNTTAFEHILPLLWEHMRCTLGWQLMLRQGRDPWYVMPNVDVWELRPNVNLFESIIDAVEAYLAPVATNIKRMQVASATQENSAKRHKPSHYDAKDVAPPADLTVSSEVAPPSPPPRATRATSLLLPVDDTAPTTPGAESRSLVKTPRSTTPRKLVTDAAATPSRTSPRNSLSATPATTSSKRSSPRSKMQKEPESPAAPVQPKSVTKATQKAVKPSTLAVSPGAATSRSSVVSTKVAVTEEPTPSSKATTSASPKTPTKAKSASKSFESKESSPVENVITSKSALYLKNLSTKLGSVVSRKYSGPEAVPGTAATKSTAPTPKKTAAAMSATPRSSTKKASASTPSSANVNSASKTSQTPKKRSSKSTLSQAGPPAEPTTPPSVYIVDLMTPSPSQSATPSTAATITGESATVEFPQAKSAQNERAAISERPAQPTLVPTWSKATKSPIVPGTALKTSGAPEKQFRATPPVVKATIKSATALSSTPKTKNQTQLDSINNKLHNTSPMTTSSLLSVLELVGTPPHATPSPAHAKNVGGSNRKKSAIAATPTPDWSLESPGKVNKRPWNAMAGATSYPSTPKKRRNAALISTIMNCNESPLAAKSDESMASFIQETVCDEPSPIQPTSRSKSTPSSIYKAIGVDDILNTAMSQLTNQGSTPPIPASASSYVTPHVVDKTQPRMQSPAKGGREISFRTKVIQQFSHGGWRSVAPKLSDKGSYTYTHDKLNDSVRFTRDELLAYANEHDIFGNPALMDPHMVLRVVKHGGQQRKVIKSVKPRPSNDWSAIIV